MTTAGTSTREGQAAGPQRLDELDVLRALAAVAVVAIHVTAPVLALPPGGRISFWVAAAINQWARFSIPAFVFISGLALFYSYGSRQVKPLQFWRRRLGAIGFPYLIWSAFYVLLVTWAGNLPLSGLPLRLGWDLLQGSAMYQLYFVVLILQFYLLFPFLKPLGRSRLLPYLTAAALVFQYWLMARAGSPTGWANAPDWLRAILRWQDRLFPWWLGYFALGAWLGVNVAAFRRWAGRWGWPFLGVSFAATAVLISEFARRLAGPGASVAWAASGFRPLAYVYSLVASVAYVAAGLHVMRVRGLRPLLLGLARYSFGIYLVHPLVFLAWQRLLTHVHLPLGPTALLLLTLSVVVAGSYLLTRLINLLPHADLIIGKA